MIVFSVDQDSSPASKGKRERKTTRAHRSLGPVVISRAGEAEWGMKVLNMKFPLEIVRLLSIDYGNGCSA